MRKPQLAILIIVVLSVLSFGAVSIARLRPSGPPVERASIVTGPVSQTVSFPGVLLPRNRTNVFFSSIGRVEEVTVRVGDKVRKGQLLARVSSNQLEWTVRRRELELKKVMVRSAPGDKITDEQRELRALEIEQSQFELDVARAQMAATELRAPTNGTLVFVGVHEGDNAGMNTGSPPFVIAGNDDFIVEVEGEEGEIRRARSGAKAVATFAPPHAEVIEGVVTGAPTIRRMNSVPNLTVILGLTITLSHPPADIQFGRNVRVEISGDQRQDVKLAPLQSIFRYEGKDFVLLAAETGWQLVNVNLGLSDDFVAELVSGPPVGAVVAVGPSERLREIAASARTQANP